MGMIRINGKEVDTYTIDGVGVDFLTIDGSELHITKPLTLPYDVDLLLTREDALTLKFPKPLSPAPFGQRYVFTGTVKGPFSTLTFTDAVFGTSVDLKTSPLGASPVTITEDGIFFDRDLAGDFKNVNLVGQITKTQAVGPANQIASANNNLNKVRGNQMTYWAQSGMDPAVVQKVASDGFSNVEQLKTLNLPNALEIGNSAFQHNNQWVSVNLPQVRIIGPNAFAEAPRDYKLSLPSVETIELSAFQNTPLTGVLDLPSVITVGNNAFATAEFTEIKMPVVETIGVGAFSNVQVTSLDLPNVKTIGKNAFAHAPLTDLHMSQVKTIGESAFLDAKLTTLSLPNVDSIGKNAFQDSVLTDIDISGITDAANLGENSFMSVENDPSVHLFINSDVLADVVVMRKAFPRGWDKMTIDVQVT